MPGFGIRLRNPWLVVIGFFATATYPIGARVVSSTVPGGSNCAEQPSRPLRERLRSPRDTYRSWGTDKSFGVNQGISPLKFDGSAVDGVLPPMMSAISPIRYSLHSPSIAQLLQVFCDCCVELCDLGLLLAKLRHQPLHLLLEGLSVVFDLGCADVATGSEHIAVFTDVFDGRALAESGHVLVLFVAVLVPAPGMIGVGNLLNLLVSQFAVGPVHHAPHLARIDEEDLAAAVTEAPVLFVPCQEPQAGGDLRRVEELPRQRHHAVHEIRLYDVLADFTLARLVGGHRAVGQDEACYAGRR